MRKLFIIGVLVMSGFLGYSQKGNAVFLKDEWKYIDHLNSNAYFENALYEIKKLERSSQSYTPPQLDSLYFKKALIYYNSGLLDSSEANFSKVSPSSNFYIQSKFFQSYCLVHLFKYKDGKSVLNQLHLRDSVFFGLRRFQASGIALLLRDYSCYDSIVSSAGTRHYAYDQEQENMINYKRTLLSYKQKTAFKAGFLSAIVPGLGKVYTDKRGEGIAAFLQVSVLAAIATESLLNNGLYAPRTVLFGGLFSMFYIGNIWGSAVSVKLQNQQYEESIDKQILLDIHLPLRRIFQ